MNKWETWKDLDKFISKELYFNYSSQIWNHQTLTMEDFKQEILQKIYSKVNEKYINPIHYGYIKRVIKNTLNDKYNIYQFIKKGKNSLKPPLKLTYTPFDEEIYENGSIDDENILSDYFEGVILPEELILLKQHSHGNKTLESKNLIRRLKRKERK